MALELSEMEANTGIGTSIARAEAQAEESKT